MLLEKGMCTLTTALLDIISPSFTKKTLNAFYESRVCFRLFVGLQVEICFYGVFAQQNNRCEAFFLRRNKNA